jgi:hypothetical protein
VKSVKEVESFLNKSLLELGYEKVPVNCFPVVDLKYGDFATDICVRLANSSKESPYAIYKKICGKLSKELSDNAFFDNGLIYFRLSNLYQNSFDFSHDALLDQKNYTVLLPSPRSGLNEYAYLRLLSFALWQYIFLKQQNVSVKFYIFDLELKPKSSSIEIFSFVLDRLKNYTTKNLDVNGFLQCVDNTVTNSVVLLWLSYDCLDSQFFRKLLNYPRSNIEINVVPKQILRPIGINFNPERYSNISPNKEHFAILANLLWYLASPTLASELDTNIAFLDESANLPWFFSTLLERLKLLTSKIEIAISDLELDFTKDRELFVRMKCIAEYRWQAAFYGKVTIWAEVMQGFLAKINLFINSPQLRYRLENHCISSKEAYILTSVMSELSSMMSVYRNIIAREI